MGRYSKEVKDDIRSCIKEKENPSRCINNVLKEHDIPLDQKGDVLASIAKRKK